MWHVVAAYEQLVSGERSFCIKFNWSFLGGGVVLPNCIIMLLNFHCVYVLIVYKLRSGKNKNGMFMSNK
jgi:hypothetical protein